MVRWHLTQAEGTLAGAPLETILANGGVLPDAPVAAGPNRDWLARHLNTALNSARPTWLVLPDRERGNRDAWQERSGGRLELGFGRAGVALALSQINRVQAPATLIAVDQLPGPQSDTVVCNHLQLVLNPAAEGLGFCFGQVDGRLDGKSDPSVLLEQARAVAPDPEVLMLPGTGSDASLDRLMPGLVAMGSWADRAVRWEFAEARIGPLGTVGSLFNWYWLYEGYRLGDWHGQSVVLDMDTSPLMGLSVADFTA